MTTEELIACFNDFESRHEYSDFDKIPNKPSDRRDLCAFILLDKLVPGRLPMIDSASHDEIWLEVHLDELAKVATAKDIHAIVSCRVLLDGEDSLHMFV